VNFNFFIYFSYLNYLKKNSTSIFFLIFSTKQRVLF